MDQTKAPAPFRPEQLEDKLRERIRTTFAELIPEEAWVQLVRAETDRFFHGRANGQASDFATVVRELVIADVRKRVAEFLSTDHGWQDQFKPGGGMEPGPMVQEAIVKAGSEIARGLIQGLGYGVRDLVRFAISNPDAVR